MPQQVLQLVELPAEVGEGTVGLSHLVHVVALANGIALVVGSVFDLVGEGHVHWSALLGASKVDQASAWRATQNDRRPLQAEPGR